MSHTLYTLVGLRCSGGPEPRKSTLMHACTTLTALAAAAAAAAAVQ
jgi:hypothetical protein